ncbi:ChaN family lipoprotein [Scytonema tolypothrichoides VB-61278]|nr:ChaN family lipoprotein [Scytonema tolypothrichoides VB-61278]
MTQFLKTNLQALVQIVADRQRHLGKKTKKGKKKKLFFCLLPFTFYFLLITLPAYAQTIKNSCPPKSVLFPSTELVASKVFEDQIQNWNKTCGNPINYFPSFPQIILEIKKVNIVYLGEVHDNSEDHKKQLDIIQELYNQNPKIAIAMEMFQRPYQGVVNQYLAGRLTEEELVKKSEYEKRWGFPWENYAPILKFAKEKQLSVIALNTPSEISRKVAQQGLEGLTLSEQKLIPPLSEIKTDNEEYRQSLQSVFQQHQAANHANSADVENFFQAQVLWDETMAEGIAKFVKSHPNYQVIVLAGRGHIIYGYGIPDRVARRLKNDKFIQRSILLSRPDEPTTRKNKRIADFILFNSTDTQGN